MLETLGSQLHFVREIQKLQLASVTPLRSIRDESAAADFERRIGYEEVKRGLEKGNAGRRNSREMRISVSSETLNQTEDWDALGHAERKVGRYFIVETGNK